MAAYFGPWLPVVSEQGYQPFRTMVTSDFGMMVTSFSARPKQVVIMAETAATVGQDRRKGSGAG
jgi:hypothetical protein